MQGKDDSILKSVYCNYRGRVTVYDVHGQKVHELSGMLDYDKYLEIERRTDPEITQFEGLEDYRCIACELKKKKSDTEASQSTPLLGKVIDTRPAYGNFNPGGTSSVALGGQSGSLTPPPLPRIEISVDTTLPTPTVQKTLQK